MQKREVVDLHVHSHFSIPSSRQMIIKEMISYSLIKGVTIIGSGDILFEPWEKEIRDNASEDSSGFYIVDDFKIILSTEINLVFEKWGKMRKVHLILAFPNSKVLNDFKRVVKEKSNVEISPRPVVYMSPQDLLKSSKSISDMIHIIPAHIFTPWFGILGHNADFASIEECFGEQSNQIFALETGLSADPFIGYKVEQIRKFTLVSFSDAHSPSHIGREATVISATESYVELFEKLKHPGKDSFIMTIEMFPEEGKYFASGHRKCGVSVKTIENEGICPVCGRKLTVGVYQRIKELSKGQNGNFAKSPFVHILPLQELLNECRKIKKDIDVKKEYFNSIKEFGSEYEVLIFSEKEALKNALGERITECIISLREGRVNKICGFDGKYGKITLKEKFADASC